MVYLIRPLNESDKNFPSSAISVVSSEAGER